jgi:hypothetical protein
VALIDFPLIEDYGDAAAEAKSVPYALRAVRLLVSRMCAARRRSRAPAQAAVFALTSFVDLRCIGNSGTQNHLTAIAF